MVTDGILGALNMINKQFNTPEAKQAGEDIWTMLSDFDEDEWAEKSVDECAEWVKGYIREPQNDGKTTTRELKRMIVGLRMDLVKATVPRGHCPYAYYSCSSITKPDNCDDIGCNECEALFLRKMEEKIREEVNKF